MADSSKKFLLDIRQRPGNGGCAECGAKDTQWASYNIGVFLCETCASIHRSLGSHITKVKSISLDNWEEDQLRLMEAHGNNNAKEKYEQQVPSCYRQPDVKSPHALKEQWVRAKYERLEFMDPDKQLYLAPRREGYLWKRGRDDKKFNRRRFILDFNENALMYYNKEDAKEPKAKLRINDMNVTLVPEKLGNPYGMQIMFQQDGHTRNLFVYSEDGKDIIDWYTAIRAAKLARLAIAYPGATEAELCQNLTQDFVVEGWLSKTGPRQGDAYRRRWCSVIQRMLMYYEDPMDAFPKGEIFVGTKERGFEARDGVPPEIKSPGFTFTLKTPDRRFYFSAESEHEKNLWLSSLRELIDTPLSPQESSNLYRSLKKKR